MKQTRIISVVAVLSLLAYLSLLWSPVLAQSIALRFLIIPALMVLMIGILTACSFSAGIRREVLFTAYLWFAALLIAADCVHMSRFTIDDAWISARYGQSLARMGTVRWNASGTPVEGYTNFLWVLVAALAEINGLSPVVLFKTVATTLGTATCVILGYSMQRRFGPIVAAIAISILALDPRWPLHCVSGLETVPFSFLLLCLLLLVTGDRSLSVHRLRAVPLVALLLSLLRPEGVLASLILVPVAFFRATDTDARRTLVRYFCLLYLLPALIYMIWRVHHFGFLLPNTFNAKVYTKGWNFFGVIGFAKSIAPLLPAILLSAVVGLSTREIIALIFFGGFSLFYSHTSLVMNYHDRFFIVFLPLILVSIGPFLKWLVTQWRRRTMYGISRVAICITCALLILNGLRIRPTVNTFVASYSEMINKVHIQIGHALAPINGLKLAVGDAGAIPYFSGAECIDFLGLNDRKIAMMIRNGTFEAEMPEYVLSSSPDVIVLVSPKVDTVADFPFGIRRASYLISRHPLFSQYSHVLTLYDQSCDNSNYFVQVWARKSSERYREVYRRMRSLSQ